MLSQAHLASSSLPQTNPITLLGRKIGDIAGTRPEFLWRHFFMLPYQTNQMFMRLTAEPGGLQATTHGGLVSRA